MQELPGCHPAGLSTTGAPTGPHAAPHRSQGALVVGVQFPRRSLSLLLVLGPQVLRHQLPPSAPAPPAGPHVGPCSPLRPGLCQLQATGHYCQFGARVCPHRATRGFTKTPTKTSGLCLSSPGSQSGQSGGTLSSGGHSVALGWRCVPLICPGPSCWPLRPASTFPEASPLLGAGGLQRGEAPAGGRAHV